MNIATTNQVGHVARPFGKWITAAVAISLALVSQDGGLHCPFIGYFILAMGGVWRQAARQGTRHELRRIYVGELARQADG